VGQGQYRSPELLLGWLHEICTWVALLLAFKADLILSGLHHIAKARAGAISYTIKDLSIVVHFQAHHKTISSTDTPAHARTHTPTYIHCWFCELNHICVFSHLGNSFLRNSNNQRYVCDSCNNLKVFSGEQNQLN